MNDNKSPRRWNKRSISINEPFRKRTPSPNRQNRSRNPSARNRTVDALKRPTFSRARSTSVFVKPQLSGRRTVSSSVRGGSPVVVDVEALLRLKIGSQEKKISKLRKLCVRLGNDQKNLENQLEVAKKNLVKEKEGCEIVRDECRKREELHKHDHEDLSRMEERIIQLLYEFRSRRACVSSSSGSSNVDLFFDPKYYSGKHVIVLLNELHVELRLLLSEKDHEFELLKQEFHKAETEKSKTIRRLKETIGKLKFEKNDYQFSATRALQEKSEAVDSRKVIIEESNRLMDSLRGNNDSLVNEIKKGKKLIKELNEKLQLRDDILRNRQRQVIRNTQLQNTLQKTEDEYKKRERRVKTDLKKQVNKYKSLNNDVRRVRAENEQLKEKQKKYERDSHSWNMRKVNMKVKKNKDMEVKISRLIESHEIEKNELKNDLFKTNKDHRDLIEKHKELKKSHTALLRTHRKDTRRRKLEMKRVHFQRPKTSPAQINSGGSENGDLLLLQNQSSGGPGQGGDGQDGSGQNMIPSSSGYPKIMNYRQTKEMVAAKFYKRKLREKEKENKKLEARIKRLLHKSNMKLDNARSSNVHLHQRSSFRRKKDNNNPYNNSSNHSIGENFILFGDGISDSVQHNSNNNNDTISPTKKKKRKSYGDQNLKTIAQKEREIRKLQEKNEGLKRLVVENSRRSRLQSM